MTQPTGDLGKSAGVGSERGEVLATIDDRHVVAAYARWAPIYDWSFGAFTRSPCRAAVAAMNEIPPGRILEIGVGTGISLPLYDRKHRVTGIDLSPKMLDIAREHEMVHVRQYERWGPLFGPAYLLSSFALWITGRRPYLDNPFEKEASREDLDC